MHAVPITRTAVAESDPAFSALPDAPVVPAGRRAPWLALRAAVADLLAAASLRIEPTSRPSRRWSGRGAAPSARTA